MYSEKIRSKADIMFHELSQRVSTIVSDSSASGEAINKVTTIVSSELASRSKSILSDMLFDLSDAVLKSEFFVDISRQNKFYAMNLRQEIMSKYQFAPSTTVDYQEASKEVAALTVGGTIFAGGGALAIGTVLISGLSISSLVPIPIGVLLVASIGAALADYHVVAPQTGKKQLLYAMKQYLAQAERQFLAWFNEVEKYFYSRVEEIKKTM